MPCKLYLAFIGAGQVNFGGGEGPWDHATRLENLGIAFLKENQAEIVFAAISDPVLDIASAALEKRKRQNDSDKRRMWESTLLFPDYIEMLEHLQQFRPNVGVYIGVPPGVHGSHEPPKDMELHCWKAGIHMFIEKPLSCHPLESTRIVKNKLENWPSKDLPVFISVGYMFRYSKAVQKMKQLVDQYCNGQVKACLARYNCAYDTITKRHFWDVQANVSPF